MLEAEKMLVVKKECLKPCSHLLGALCTQEVFETPPPQNLAHRLLGAQ